MSSPCPVRHHLIIDPVLETVSFPPPPKTLRHRRLREAVITIPRSTSPPIVLELFVTVSSPSPSVTLPVIVAPPLFVKVV